MKKLVKTIKPWVIRGFMIFPVIGVLSTGYELMDPGNALTAYEKTHSESCSGELFRTPDDQLFFCVSAGIPTVLAMNTKFPLKFGTNDPLHVLLLGLLYGGGFIAWAYFLTGRLRKL